MRSFILQLEKKRETLAIIIAVIGFLLLIFSPEDSQPFWQDDSDSNTIISEH